MKGPTHLVNHDEGYIISVPAGCGGDALIELHESVDRIDPYDPEYREYYRMLLVRNPYARIVVLYEEQAERLESNRFDGSWPDKAAHRDFNRWFTAFSNELWLSHDGVWTGSLYKHWSQLHGIINPADAKDEHFLRAEYDLEQFGLENVSNSGWQKYYLKSGQPYARVKNHNKVWCDKDCELLSCAGFAEEYPHSSNW